MEKKNIVTTTAIALVFFVAGIGLALNIAHDVCESNDQIASDTNNYYNDADMTSIQRNITGMFAGPGTVHFNDGRVCFCNGYSISCNEFIKSLDMMANIWNTNITSFIIQIDPCDCNTREYLFNIVDRMNEEYQLYDLKGDHYLASAYLYSIVCLVSYIEAMDEIDGCMDNAEKWILTANHEQSQMIRDIMANNLAANKEFLGDKGNADYTELCINILKLEIAKWSNADSMANVIVKNGNESQDGFIALMKCGNADIIDAAGKIININNDFYSNDLPNISSRKSNADDANALALKKNLYGLFLSADTISISDGIIYLCNGMSTTVDDFFNMMNIKSGIRNPVITDFIAHIVPTEMNTLDPVDESTYLYLLHLEEYLCGQFYEFERMNNVSVATAYLYSAYCVACYVEYVTMIDFELGNGDYYELEDRNVSFIKEKKLLQGMLADKARVLHVHAGNPNYDAICINMMKLGMSKKADCKTVPEIRVKYGEESRAGFESIGKCDIDVYRFMANDILSHNQDYYNNDVPAAKKLVGANTNTMADSAIMKYAEAY